MFTECSAKEQETLRYRAQKRRKAVPKSHRKERAPALCKVTYIAARAGETE